MFEITDFNIEGEDILTVGIGDSSKISYMRSKHKTYETKEIHAAYQVLTLSVVAQ